MADAKTLAEQLAALDTQVRVITRALDFVDLHDPDESRELARTIRWAHERRLAGDARHKDVLRYLITFVSAVCATVVASLAARYFGLGK
jgi:hypothetical protein